MSLDTALNVYFVITGKTKDEVEAATKEFDNAQTYLRNHLSESRFRQIKASEGYPLIAAGLLTKQDVFVFDRFEGDFFQQLAQTKSLIIGPRCLTTCLLKCEPIPLGTNPVYTTAMRNLRISASGLSAAEKERLRSLIQWMGGHYFLNFDSSITHLVANTIKSTKYEVASLNGIPVMHVDWVQRVWDRSCSEDVAATDKEFDKYRLPIFFGTNITCTGLDNKKKNEIMRLVNENGGVYHKAFRSNAVDIVITEANKTNSDKYLAAVHCKKDILLPEWIFDSIEKGFALPTKTYQVKTLKVSTPTKTDQTLADFTQADISRISVVGARTSSEVGTINDTMASSLNQTQESTLKGGATPLAMTSSSNTLQRQILKKHTSGNYYRAIYDEICPKKAKKAGIFLDGCCVYLSGFQNKEKEKLNRILNAGGATRYDSINEKITHIIVGQLDDAEFRNWKKNGLLTAANIVRLDWLLESIKLKQTASESAYRVPLPPTLEPDAPSPSSKRTLRSMNHSFKQPELPIKKKLFADPKKDNEPRNVDNLSSINLPRGNDDEQHLIAVYSQSHAGLPLPPLRNMSQSENSTMLPHPIASSTLANRLSQPASTINAASTPKPATNTNTTEMTMNTIDIDYKNLDFLHGASVYIDKNHFPEDFYSQMIDECEAAHGNVVDANFRDPVDYAIVSFERIFDESQLPVKVRHIVTDLYVEACMKQNKLVPIEYYHKHIPHTVEVMPLQGMTIVISTYTGLEQDFIDSLAQLMGARTNVTYAKKERPLLVCPKPEGSKYEAAIKWGYPVVTSDWLVHCAEQATKLQYDNYLVGKSSKVFPISPPLRDQNSMADTPARTTLRDEQNTMNMDGMETTARVPTPTSTREDLTPLRYKRVSELAAPSRNTRASLTKTPDSPHTPVNRASNPSYNYDIMEEILANIENENDRELVREVIMEMRNSQTPELERIRRQACTPIHSKVPTPKGIPEFCTTPEFEKRMADALERRWRLPTKRMKPDTPIEELRRRVLRATCQAMGLQIDDDEDGDATPTTSSRVTTGNRKPPTPASATMQAHRTFGNAGVASHSTVAQQSPSTSSYSRRSDTFVPNTQTPNNSVHQEQSVLGQRASILGKSSINFDKISFEETEVVAASTSNINAASATAKSSPEMRQLTDYLKNCESRRQSMKRSASNGQEKASIDTADLETQAHNLQPFESEQFGPNTEEAVGWRDPAEFRGKPTSTMQYKGTPKFLISCIEDGVREDVIRKIKLLGGEVDETNSNNFDPTCTHFVCERPNRGEKILSCISSGKWVLSLQYIDESYAQNAFINEELHEWGNLKALNLPELKTEEQIIAQAAYRWHKHLAENGNITGAFTGFRAILRLSQRNLNALHNVLTAGDAIVIDAKSPYSEADGAHQATHCFVDLKKAPLTQVDYKFLKDHNVKVVSQMYINSYLMNDNNVSDLERYEIKL